MTEMLTETSWLLNGKNSLLRMRQELWLTEGEIAIVDRGIAALDRLVTAIDRNDSSGGILAHHHASGCETEFTEGRRHMTFRTDAASLSIAVMS